jgi:hypothetical protein
MALDMMVDPPMSDLIHIARIQHIFYPASQHPTGFKRLDKTGLLIYFPHKSNPNAPGQGYRLRKHRSDNWAKGDSRAIGRTESTD